jgi:hypothetical protein
LSVLDSGKFLDFDFLSLMMRRRRTAGRSARTRLPFVNNHIRVSFLPYLLMQVYTSYQSTLLVGDRLDTKTIK